LAVATSTPVPTPKADSSRIAETAPVSAPQTVYETVSVTSDNACSADSISGLVLDSAGNPIAGAQIISIDQWGNFVDAVTQSGAEAGRFTMAIGSDAREYYVTVVDAAGAPLSFTVTIAHLTGDTSLDRCHTIVWQGR